MKLTIVFPVSLCRANDYVLIVQVVFVAKELRRANEEQREENRSRYYS